MTTTTTRTWTTGEQEAAKAAWKVLETLNAVGTPEDLLAYGDQPIWKAAERTLWLIFKQVSGSSAKATRMLAVTYDTGDPHDALLGWAADDLRY